MLVGTDSATARPLVEATTRLEAGNRPAILLGLATTLDPGFFTDLVVVRSAPLD